MEEKKIKVCKYNIYYKIYFKNEVNYVKILKK